MPGVLPAWQLVDAKRPELAEGDRIGLSACSTIISDDPAGGTLWFTIYIPPLHYTHIHRMAVVNGLKNSTPYYTSQEPSDSQVEN